MYCCIHYFQVVIFPPLTMTSSWNLIHVHIFFCPVFRFRSSYHYFFFFWFWFWFSVNSWFRLLAGLAGSCCLHFCSKEKKLELAAQCVMYIAQKATLACLAGWGGFCYLFSCAIYVSYCAANSCLGTGSANSGFTFISFNSFLFCIANSLVLFRCSRWASVIWRLGFTTGPGLCFYFWFYCCFWHLNLSRQSIHIICMYVGIYIEQIQGGRWFFFRLHSF